MNEIGLLGELLLDRTGVVLMASLFETAVGFCFLPFRLALPRGLAAGALATGLGLAALFPFIFGLPWFAVLIPFLMIVALISVLMLPAMFLIPRQRQKELRFALGGAVATLAFLVIAPMIGHSSSWDCLLALLAAPLLMGAPLAVVLLCSVQVQRRPRLLVAGAALCFAASGFIWALRAHYQGLIG
jgi:hypothetical protein